MSADSAAEIFPSRLVSASAVKLGSVMAVKLSSLPKPVTVLSPAMTAAFRPSSDTMPRRREVWPGLWHTLPVHLMVPQAVEGPERKGIQGLGGCFCRPIFRVEGTTLQHAKLDLVAARIRVADLRGEIAAGQLQYGPVLGRGEQAGLDPMGEAEVFQGGSQLVPVLSDAARPAVEYPKAGPLRCQCCEITA